MKLEQCMVIKLNKNIYFFFGRTTLLAIIKRNFINDELQKYNLHGASQYNNFNYKINIILLISSTLVDNSTWRLGTKF